MQDARGLSAQVGKFYMIHCLLVVMLGHWITLDEFQDISDDLCRTLSSSIAGCPEAQQGGEFL